MLRVFVTRLSRVFHPETAVMEEISMRIWSEVDTGDQFIDAASQPATQRRFALAHNCNFNNVGGVASSGLVGQHDGEYDLAGSARTGG
jgi:hypothetical protein